MTVLKNIGSLFTNKLQVDSLQRQYDTFASIFNEMGYEYDNDLFEGDLDD